MLVAVQAPAYNRSVNRDLNKRIMALRFRAKLKFGWRVFRDPETPFAAKCVLPAVLAYLAMPLDLIPDFIPVLGLLDDVVIVPLFVWLAVRMIPKRVLTECRSQVQNPR